METRARKRRDSDSESVASVSSEPAISRSRSTTPFTLRSQCARHGSECPEGHGIHFHSRLSTSPKRSSASKKSLKKTPIKSNGIRKTLLFTLEEHISANGKSQHEIEKKVVTLTTSDYSSAEDESVVKNTPPATPLLQQSIITKTSPIPRSAEKTDYTYANSASYRTAVTPERVILMPNMTRRTIERSQGDGFSSPELKKRSTPFFAPASGKLSSGISISYGADCDSEDEEDYKINALPSNSLASQAYSFTYSAYSKIRKLSLWLSWWIYLAICYSLFLDTCALQTTGVAKLRNFCRHQAKNTRVFLLLFFLLPLCLFTGGFLYSALPAFSLNLLDEPINPVPNAATPETVTYTQVFTPPAHISEPLSESPKLKEARQNLEDELKLTKDSMIALQGKILSADDKIEILASELASLRMHLQSVEAETKPCCDKTPPQDLDHLIGVKLSVLASQQSGQNDLVMEDVAVLIKQLKEAQAELNELQKWKQSMESLEGKILQQLSIQIRDGIDDKEKLIMIQVMTEVENAINKWERDSKPSMFNDLKERLVVEITKQIKSMEKSSKSGGLSREEVEKMIHVALGIYDSDKTGLADYALESAGGGILSTRCTETFNSHRPRLSIWGFSLWSEPNNPRIVIQPGIVPGQCWSFRGFDGYLVIQLSRRIIPTSFTLEHIPKSLAPDGRIDSAPRNFTVYGLANESDTTGVQLGRYTYDSNGEPLQTFHVQETNTGAFSIVELRIHSNYGNLNYTCLYRFRVHGHIAT